jgi:hypothetical protein
VFVHDFLAVVHQFFIFRNSFIFRKSYFLKQTRLWLLGLLPAMSMLHASFQ